MLMSPTPKTPRQNLPERLPRTVASTDLASPALKRVMCSQAASTGSILGERTHSLLHSLAKSIDRI